MRRLLKSIKNHLTHLDVTKHLLQIMTATAQSQVVEDVLVHQLNVRITESHRAIGVSVWEHNK